MRSKRLPRPLPPLLLLALILPAALADAPTPRDDVMFPDPSPAVGETVLGAGRFAASLEASEGGIRTSFVTGEKGNLHLLMAGNASSDLLNVVQATSGTSGGGLLDLGDGLMEQAFLVPSGTIRIGRVLPFEVEPMGELASRDGEAWITLRVEARRLAVGNDTPEVAEVVVRAQVAARGEVPGVPPVTLAVAFVALALCLRRQG